jgi:hypothetical protein
VESLGRRGCRVEFHAAVNDVHKHVFEQAHELAIRLNARIIDARTTRHTTPATYAAPVSAASAKPEPLVRYRPVRRVLSPA